MPWRVLRLLTKRFTDGYVKIKPIKETDISIAVIGSSIASDLSGKFPISSTEGVFMSYQPKLMASVIGEFQMDLILGTKGKGAILTVTDRMKNLG